MDVMKRLLCLVWASAGLACAADVSNVHSVYVLPMAHGLDQYLANRLTSAKVFQVVIDPKLADAVFTDRLGEGFEQQLANLLPPPPAPAKKDSKEEERAPVLFGDSVNKLSNPALNSSFGRGKGTIFLVDMKSHTVVWSVFEPPKGTGGHEMDRTASDIVTRLRKDLGLSK